ncbi:MAG: hypothetical protein H6713_33805 [Myxococcales bacterium]|nr:hypothetical protein [Myxococcales bacterium]MCB9754939.1 hypothetical protein [Myxococcales bacterium]
MNASSIVLLVAGILALQVLLWIPIIAWLRRRTRQRLDALAGELTGEAIVLGPQAAVYRGSSCGLPRVKGNGVMALTEARLVFVFLTGGRLELPLSTLTGVRDDVWFLRSYHGGRPHVIAQREDGEVGFIVTAHDDWMHALRERVGAARPTSAP